MLNSRTPYKPPRRQVLADSHVAAVAIAALCLLAIDCVVRGLWEPCFRVAYYVFKMIAILDVPYFAFTSEDRFVLVSSLSYIFVSFVSAAAAWVLSRWVYGTRPLSSLATYRMRVVNQDHV